MRTLLKMAWRDLWRNRRRSLINIFAVGVGLFLVLLYGSLVGTVMRAKDQLDDGGMGHIEVTAPGWRQHRNVRQALENPKSTVTGLPLPPGSDVSFRVVSRGLATSARGSKGVAIHGIDPAIEATVAAYVNKLRAGKPLAADDERGVLLGDKLAEDLRLQVGQKVRLMVQRADGEVGADLFRVRGIIHPLSPALSRSLVLVTAAAAQRTLGLADVAHQIVIQLPLAAETDAVAERLRTRFGERAEVMTWGQLMPMMKVLEDMMGVLITVISLFVYGLVALGILNTMHMSVLERTREFGIMRAIGSRPRRVVALVMGEAFWIATLGVVLGLGAGILLTKLGSGPPVLDYTSKMGESFDFAGMVMRSRFIIELPLGESLRAAALVYAVTLLTAIYPAFRVSRIQPAQAIHSV
ncbi:MAG: ABC transporter permease [Deltaproteobacteria bacterium]|nr:ABC transporter permease [Deltaproteobacteria bacterium]